MSIRGASNGPRLHAWSVSTLPSELWITAVWSQSSQNNSVLFSSHSWTWLQKGRGMSECSGCGTGQGKSCSLCRDMNTVKLTSVVSSRPKFIFSNFLLLSNPFKQSQLCDHECQGWAAWIRAEAGSASKVCAATAPVWTPAPPQVTWGQTTVIALLHQNLLLNRCWPLVLRYYVPINFDLTLMHKIL